jgi:hypothetical protein
VVRRQGYLESGGGGIKYMKGCPEGRCTPQGDKVGEESPEMGACRARTARNKGR